MTSPGVDFVSFFNGWLNGLQSLLQQLHQAIEPQNAQNTDHFKCLIDQVFSHYKLYYRAKANAGIEDAFVILNPPWLSSFELTLLWLGDFKPSVIFRLLERSVTDLTPQQVERIEQVKLATRREETALSETMAMIQESLASQPILHLARRFRRLVDGEVSEAEEAVDRLKRGMLNVFENADTLRGLSAGNVMEVLNPIQGIRFLAAAANFQLRMRRLGQERDARG